MHIYIYTIRKEVHKNDYRGAAGRALTLSIQTDCFLTSLIWKPKRCSPSLLPTANSCPSLAASQQFIFECFGNAILASLIKGDCGGSADLFSPAALLPFHAASSMCLKQR